LSRRHPAYEEDRVGVLNRAAGPMSPPVQALEALKAWKPVERLQPVVPATSRPRARQPGEGKVAAPVTHAGLGLSTVVSTMTVMRVRLVLGEDCRDTYSRCLQRETKRAMGCAVEVGAGFGGASGTPNAAVAVAMHTGPGGRGKDGPVMVAKHAPDPRPRCACACACVRVCVCACECVGLCVCVCVCM
jgi:hypothetical protein